MVPTFDFGIFARFVSSGCGLFHRRIWHFFSSAVLENPSVITIFLSLGGFFQLSNLIVVFSPFAVYVSQFPMSACHLLFILLAFGFVFTQSIYYLNRDNAGLNVVKDRMYRSCDTKDESTCTVGVKDIRHMTMKRL